MVPAVQHSQVNHSVLKCISFQSVPALIHSKINLSVPNRMILFEALYIQKPVTGEKSPLSQIHVLANKAEKIERTNRHQQARH